MKKLINIEINKKYYPSIANFFSPIVLASIENNYHSSYFTEICHNSQLLKNIDLSTTIGNFFDSIFHFLLKNYRNEYVYKNIIANKILLGRHSLKTSQVLTEFRIGRNKADIIILNGTSTVYEIKSEFDSFKRLNEQISSYTKAFEYVNVITSPSHIKKALNHLSENIGVLSFTERNTISTVRTPKSNIKHIELPLLFESLRKEEYLQIIKSYYGHIPKVPNTKIYNECKMLYCNIPFDKAIKLTIEVLKKRNYSDFLIQHINNIPHSLIAYVLSIGKNDKRVEKFLNVMNRRLIDII
jgi:hypothetical protein